MRSKTLMIKQAWPSTLFLSDWEGFETHAPGLRAAILAEAAGFAQPVASGIAPAAKPPAGLVESPLGFFETSRDPHVQALARWCATNIRLAVSKVNGAEVTPERLQVVFSDSWFHVTNQGGFHDAHTHGNCSWCGIFYAEIGETALDPTGAAGNGVNRFYAPLSRGGLVSDYGNAYLRDAFLDVPPQNGRLVLFPSYLLHAALPYQGETDRIIVSFNSRTYITPDAQDG
ncbi:MAG: TIGR02466 family protein [Pseudomonadota bacterium]